MINFSQSVDLTALGVMTDTLQETVATNKSAVAYLKGLIQDMAQEKTIKCARLSTTSNVFSDVINITDKGKLIGISTRTMGAQYALIIVTVDGTIVIDETGGTLGLVDGVNVRSGVYNCKGRFNTSLRVQLANTGASVEVLADVFYTID